MRGARTGPKSRKAAERALRSERRRNESTLRRKVKAWMLLNTQQQLRVARMLPGDAKRPDAPPGGGQKLTHKQKKKKKK